MASKPERSLTKIVLFGVTGSGKSSLANALLGLEPDDPEGFKTSPLATSCTEFTSHIDGHWLGDTTAPTVRFIDTPGHGDSEGRDTELRQDMVNRLKREQVVHAFIWVKNSQNPRIAQQELDLLAIVDEVFGQGFDQNVVMVLTRWGFSKSAEKLRKRQGSTLEAYKRDLLKKKKASSYPHIIVIDALYSTDDDKETQMFVKGAEELRNFVDEMGERPMEDIQMVKSKLESVKHEMEELIKKTEEMEREKTELQLQQANERIAAQGRMYEERLAAERQLFELKAEHKRLEEQLKHQSSGSSWCTLL